MAQAIESRAVEHWRSLDGLRGLAILFVVFSHLVPAALATAGMVGVTLFFVLSGFLITNLLLVEEREHGSVALPAFYGRRAIRLLPALFVYLAVIGLIYGWEITWPPLVYAGNYAQLFGLNLEMNLHTWSLAVEEHFYLLWPILLIGVPATRKPRWLGLAVLLLIGWRLAVPSDQWAYQASDTNAFALGLGCLLAVLRARGTWRPPESGIFLRAPLLGLLALGAWPVNSAEEFISVGRWLPIVAALFSCVVVWAAVQASDYLMLANVPLRWFGRISYALYLWHLPVIYAVRVDFGRTWTSMSLAFLISVGLAAISWRIVEAPMLTSRLRARFERVPQSGVVDPTTTGRRPAI